MRTNKINLCKIEDLKEFCRSISSIDGDVNVKRGNYIVDGKSLLGIMSLDLSQPIDVDLYSEDPETIFAFDKICERFK